MVHQDGFQHTSPDGIPDPLNTDPNTINITLGTLPLATVLVAMWSYLRTHRLRRCSNPDSERTSPSLPPPADGVARYLRWQQQQILDSCRRATTPTTRSPSPSLAATRILEIEQHCPPAYQDLSPRASIASESSSRSSGRGNARWSDGTPPPPPMSELPVRDGCRGYGPEYEMAGESTRPGRRERPPWARDEGEEKFLLADVVELKARARLRVAADNVREASWFGKGEEFA